MPSIGRLPALGGFSRAFVIPVRQSDEDPVRQSGDEDPVKISVS